MSELFFSECFSSGHVIITTIIISVFIISYFHMSNCTVTRKLTHTSAWPLSYLSPCDASFSLSVTVLVFLAALSLSVSVSIFPAIWKRKSTLANKKYEAWIKFDKVLNFFEALHCGPEMHSTQFAVWCLIHGSKKGFYHLRMAESNIAIFWFSQYMKLW